MGERDDSSKGDILGPQNVDVFASTPLCTPTLDAEPTQPNQQPLALFFLPFLFHFHFNFLLVFHFGIVALRLGQGLNKSGIFPKTGGSNRRCVDTQSLNIKVAHNCQD